MRVHNHPLVFSECIAEDHVRRFAANARQGNEGIEFIRHPTTVTCGNGTRHADQALALVPEKAGAADQLLQLIRVCGRKVGRGRVSRKKRWSDHVDALVGALRAQDGGYQQFVRAAMVEFTVRVGIVFAQPLIDGGRPRDVRSAFASAYRHARKYTVARVAVRLLLHSRNPGQRIHQFVQLPDARLHLAPPIGFLDLAGAH